MPKKAWSRIKIISTALAKVGKGPINNTSELDDFGNFAEDIYDAVVPAILAGRYWSFANAVVGLNKLTTTPILDKWKYAYQIPADYLTANGVTPFSDYDIYEDKIYSNVDGLYLDYRFYPDESKFPPNFVMYLINLLAVEYAPAAEVDQETFAKLALDLRKWEGIAVSTSGQAKPNRRVRSSPFLNARSAGYYEPYRR